MESLLLAALRSAPVALVAIDDDGRILLGAGARLDLLTSPADSELLRPVVAAVARRARRGEVTAEIREGETDVSIWAAPRRDTAGEVVGVVVLATDVTDLRRAEHEARSALKFVDSVVENIPDMIFVKDARDLRFVRFNAAGERLVGSRREELIGKSDYDFFPREQADSFVANDRAVLASGRMLDIPEEVISTPSGARLLHTKKIPIADDHGRPLYLLGISEDVTDRKALEREREELLRRMQEVDQLKDTFLANVSHELRTPLALVTSLVERVHRDATLPEGHRRDLEQVMHSARLLRGLVDDLLEVSTLEAGRPTLRYAETDLALQTRRMVAAFEDTAQQRSIALRVEAPPSVRAQVDRDCYDRILVNLISNALKATPDGGWVVCTLRSIDDTVDVSVADSGPGVPVADRERIFERFLRGAGSEGGVGLGLPIVRELVAAHGGTVNVGDAPRGGALFSIRLPRRAPPGTDVLPGTALGSAPAFPAPARPPPPREPAADGGPIVLVVEDNVELNRFLVEALEGPYRVAAAHDGAEGLQLARRFPPDLVVTDLMMPRMDGEALLGAIRGDPDLHDVPVMVLTALAGESRHIRLLSRGAQDYLVKPFSTEELLTRARNLVATKRARDVLRRELDVRGHDIDELVHRLADRTRELAAALGEVERALRERDESLALARTRAGELAAILDRIPEPVVVCEPDGTVSMQNRAAARLAGSEESYVGRPLSEVVAVESARRLDGSRMTWSEIPLVRALAGEEVDEQMMRYQFAGRDVVLAVAAAPVWAVDGSVAAALCVYRDVTAQDTFDRLRAHFVRTAAHELKTPVSVIKGFAQVAARQLTTAEGVQASTLAYIERGVRRIERVVDDLVLASAVMVGTIELRSVPVALKSLVDRALARAQVPPERIRTEGEPVTVMADPDRTVDVLYVLLENAVKYSPGGEVVDVATARRHGEGVVVVTDRGIGIPEDRLEHLFTAFYRAHAETAEDYGGLGIGLYVARQLVTRMGGRIGYEHRPGGGSIFTISLPLAEEGPAHGR